MAWAYVLLVFVVTVSRAITSRPLPLLQALQAGFPVTMIGVPLVFVVAAATRRWIQAAAALVFLATSWFAVSPALGRDPLPFWLNDATELRIASSNLYAKNQVPGEAAATLFATNADLLVVSELTPRFVAAATAAGFDGRYPYRLLDPRESVSGISANGGLGLYSRYPIDDVVRVGRDRAPFARLALPDGRRIRVLPVHAESPSTSPRVGRWAADLAQLGRLVESAEDPVLLVGDFNASRWQPAFGALLRRGLTDAHEAVGLGLSRSWPDAFPLFRLDHALYSRQFAARSVRDFRVPGSDHLAFVATIALQPR